LYASGVTSPTILEGVLAILLHCACVYQRRDQSFRRKKQAHTVKTAAVTADGRQQTADSRQQTADSRQQMELKGT
jgi:hypothetical protein